jgi:riboflavin synthase
MFNGIIDAIGQVRANYDAPGGRSLTVQARDYWRDARPGASIAVDGVCLTIAGIDGEAARFDVVAESLRRSTLGELRPGGRVNLQKSVAAGDRIDGHFVQGHVDAVGTVLQAEQRGGESMWWFTLDDDPSGAATLWACIVPKGSIAIDGISLTVAEVGSGRFSAAITPTTLRQTTIGEKRSGARVNVETDVIARTVIYYLRRFGSSGGAPESPAATGRTDAMMDLLKREGFA